MACVEDFEVLLWVSTESEEAGSGSGILRRSHLSKLSLTPTVLLKP